MTTHRLTAAVGALGLCLLLAASCSDNSTLGTGGGGSPFDPIVDGTEPSLPATHLQLVIHDAPAIDIREAWVTFAGVSVHAVDGDWLAVAGPFPITVDLLTLVDGRTLVLADTEVPAGAYDGVRFGVASASVVDAGGATRDVSLPAGGVSVDHDVDFTCKSGVPLTVTLDFPVASSFQVTGAGVGFTPTIVTDTVRLTR